MARLRLVRRVFFAWWKDGGDTNVVHEDVNLAKLGHGGFNCLVDGGGILDVNGLDQGPYARRLFFDPRLRLEQFVLQR